MKYLHRSHRSHKKRDEDSRINKLKSIKSHSKTYQANTNSTNVAIDLRFTFQSSSNHVKQTENSGYGLDLISYYPMQSRTFRRLEIDKELS